MCIAAQTDPRVRRLIAIGMMFLVLSFATEALKHSLRISPNSVDFARGAFLGICLALEMRALWLVRRMRREG